MQMHAAVRENITMEAAGGSLLEFVLDPRNWIHQAQTRSQPSYQRQVGSIRVCASVDVMPTLETYIHVSFRGPELSPIQAADLLEGFVKQHFGFAANTEWHVEIDARKWIHFVRRYTARTLSA